jgi:hypothetical protein
VVYYGDNTVYRNLPHAGRKKNTRPYKRTKPNDIKQRCLSEKPKQVYDKMLTEKSPTAVINGVTVPRNEKQIKNIQAKARVEAKQSHDSLYALHLLEKQLEYDYIISIKTCPDLEVFVGNSELFAELNKLLQVKDIDIELYYDTTFNLGDFYVSTLAIQHPMFKEQELSVGQHARLF